MIDATPHQTPRTDGPSLARLALKTGVLFLILNVVFASLNPLPALGRISAYNYLLPGRTRLPYGENPSRAYNLSLYSLPAMIASHELAAAPVPVPANEYRVVVIGDSSVWGYRLPASETLTAQLNRSNTRLPDGRRLRVYNLGYPVMSLTKDLLLLDMARSYAPQLVVWCVTLESFATAKQLFPPLLQNNPDELRALAARYALPTAVADARFVEPDFFARTLLGQRRNLADLLRLQLYGPLWAATGVDQDIPDTYVRRMEDLPANTTFAGFAPGQLTQPDLAFDVLAAGFAAARPAELLLVNEPMFVSAGANSDLRYNFFYPRWAYDQYRAWMAEAARANGWRYFDWWNAVPSGEFTDSAVHMTPRGTGLLANKLAAAILAAAASPR